MVLFDHVVLVLDLTDLDRCLTFGIHRMLRENRASNEFRLFIRFPIEMAYVIRTLSVGRGNTRVIGVKVTHLSLSSPVGPTTPDQIAAANREATQFVRTVF
jgi:hypothetical protein